MQQLIKILKKSMLKLILEVNVTDMTKNRLNNEILHTKIRSRHAFNSLKYECITGNK